MSGVVLDFVHVWETREKIKQMFLNYQRTIPVLLPGHEGCGMAGVSYIVVLMYHSFVCNFSFFRGSVFPDLYAIIVHVYAKFWHHSWFR